MRKGVLRLLTNQQDKIFKQCTTDKEAINQFWHPCSVKLMCYAMKLGLNRNQHISITSQSLDYILLCYINDIDFYFIRRYDSQ